MMASFSPALARRAAMRVPLVVRRPVPRGDDDRQLVQLRRHRRVEAHRRAELLREVAHLRAAQQDVERPRRAAALARDQVLEHLLLRRGHRLIGQRREAVADQFHAVRIRRLGARAWVLCGHDANGTDHADEHTPERDCATHVSLHQTDLKVRRHIANPIVPIS